jgi:hypothetical protein
LRIPISGVATIAPKSVFTAFRVPLMNLTHALMPADAITRFASTVAAYCWGSAPEGRSRLTRRGYSAHFCYPIVLIFGTATVIKYEHCEKTRAEPRTFGLMRRLAQKPKQLAAGPRVTQQWLTGLFRFGVTELSGTVASPRFRRSFAIGESQGPAEGSR